MTETRHKTTIEIGVDDRQVVGLSKSMERAFNVQILDNFEKGLQRIQQRMEKMGAGASAPAAPGMPGLGAPKGGATPGGAGMNDLIREIRELREELKKSNTDARKAARAGGAGGGVFRGMLQFHLLQQLLGMGPGLVGGSATASALGAIPYIGGTLGAAAQTSVRLYNEYAQQQMAQAAVFGQTGIGRGGMGALVARGVRDFGITPGMTPGLVAQFAAASGLQGNRLSGAFGSHLAFSQLLGVNAAGSLVGAAEVGGGRVSDPVALMEEAVGAGIASGIRETRLDAYLQGMSSFTEEARSRGIPIAPESVISLFTAFQMSGASFTGEAGSRFATNFGQGFGSAGRGRGFAQGLALRAAGFGRDATYQQALERLERRDPRAMQAFIDSIRGMTSDTDTGAFLIRSAMEGIGVDISAVQSRELFENGMSADATSFNRETAQGALQQRRDAAGGVFGAGRFQGGLALQRQAIGSTQARNAQRIQNLDLRVMGAGMRALGPVMNRLIGSMERLTTAFEQGGFAGLARQAMAEVVGGVTEAVAAPITELVRAAFGDEAADTYSQNLQGGLNTILDPSQSFVGDVAEAVVENQRNRARLRESNRLAEQHRTEAARRRAIYEQTAPEGRVVQFPGQSERGARNSANVARQQAGLPPLGPDAPIVAAEHLEAAAGALRQMGAPPGDVTVE